MDFCKRADIWILASVLLFVASCKPVMTGDLKVYNDSQQDIYVQYSNSSGEDTVTKRITPGTDVVLILLDGPGDATKVKCCPCNTTIYKIYTPAGAIKKDPMNSTNWIIPNRNELKKHGKEPVKCEFHVRDSDL